MMTHPRVTIQSGIGPPIWRHTLATIEAAISRWVPVMTRIRFKRKAALKARLDLKAQQLRDEAKSSPPGHKRDSLLRKAKRNEIASDIITWLTSPGL